MNHSIEIKLDRNGIELCAYFTTVPIDHASILNSFNELTLIKTLVDMKISPFKKNLNLQ